MTIGIKIFHIKKQLIFTGCHGNSIGQNNLVFSGKLLLNYSEKEMLMFEPLEEK